MYNRFLNNLTQTENIKFIKNKEYEEEFIKEEMMVKEKEKETLKDKYIELSDKDNTIVNTNTITNNIDEIISAVFILIYFNLLIKLEKLS